MASGKDRFKAPRAHVRHILRPLVGLLTQFFPHRFRNELGTHNSSLVGGGVVSGALCSLSNTRIVLLSWLHRAVGR